jgi:D-alanine-D-alanine ligase
MNKIVVLAGGQSNEREVSLRSGKAVAEALRTKGYDVSLLDPKIDLENIGKPDAVFPALHGKGGEDGTVQAALEAAGIPYVGSGVASSALCFDKWLYREILLAAGLPMAKGEVVTPDTIWRSPLSQKPFVLKPVQGGSSLDTHILRNIDTLDKPPLTKTVGRYGTMLLEELITGVEITVAVLGDQPLPAVEIIPPTDGNFDYENKYNGATQELCPPKHVDDVLHKRARQLALQAHRLTGCRDLSRTDIMVAPQGELYILETNTLPGMTGESLFPKAAAAAGVPFPELADRLIQMALSRRTPA